MPIPETQRDLLSYLDLRTRELDVSRLDPFTTAAISRSLSVSRNLASQYLNDLVRQGLAVKVGTRPLYFFHRHNLERYLQARLTKDSYASMEGLLALRGRAVGQDFERAVGYDLSLSSAIEQMRVAMGYPPCGLPVLIMGASGTGKTYLAELMLEYGKNVGLLDKDASTTIVDCSRYQVQPETIVKHYLGGEDRPGWVETAKGGLLVFKHIELLPQIQREYLFTRSLLAARAEQGLPERGLRFVFTSELAPTSDEAVEFSRRLPVVVGLPTLAERTLEERGGFVLHFLKDEGRRMGVDVLVSRGAFNCLATAEFDDNISELRRSITDACAEAYLARGGENRITVHTYRLPANVLNRVDPAQAMADSTLFDATKIDVSAQRRGLDDFIRKMIDSFQLFRAGEKSSDELKADLLESLCELEDFLSSGRGLRGPRLAAFERLLGMALSSINDKYDSSLSNATARLLAQMVYAQLWPEERMIRLVAESKQLLNALAALVSSGDADAAALSARVVLMTKQLLGLELGAPGRLLLLLHISMLEKE